MTERMKNRLAVIIDQELGLVVWEDEEIEDVIESVVHDLAGFLDYDGWVRQEIVEEWRVIEKLGAGSVVKDAAGAVYFRTYNALGVWRMGGMDKNFRAEDMAYPVKVLEWVDS